ncbi:unnamed protein product [Urochloa humidicola]
MRLGRVRLNAGRLATARDPATLRAAAAELLATAVFVFAAAVACTLSISGGHVNPAVTMGALLGGRICLVRSLLYWAAQLLGAAAAALLLRVATGGVRLPEYPLAGGMTGPRAAVLEAAMAFGLMYAYYATAIEQRMGRAGAVAPLAVGLLAGANVLACGAVMNPARAFGPAIVGSRSCTNHWVGPMVGAGLSGFIYEHLVLGQAQTQAGREEPNRGATHRRA